MLKLYHTLDDENVINKDLVHMKDFDIKFKDSVDISTPEIKLRVKDDFEVIECNYAFIEEFNRYYFINTIQLLSDDIYLWSLECDVLESHKDEILNSLVHVKRSLSSGDYVEVNVITDLRKEVSLHISSVTLPIGKTLVLSAIGGV